MKIKEAVNYIKNRCELAGVPYANIVFYGGIPNPLAFQCRNSIALSIPMVEMNDPGCVASLDFRRKKGPNNLA